MLAVLRTSAAAEDGSAATGTFSPGQAPIGLNELPPPPTPPQTGRTSPAPFFGMPSGLLHRDGSNCSYQASWTMGGAKVPGSSLLLLVYGEHCVESPQQDPLVLLWTEERLSLVLYDPATNTFPSGVDRPFAAAPLSAGLPSTHQLQSPIFGGDGYLYLFAAECEGTGLIEASDCSTSSGIYVARVGATQAQWANGANYEWWDGSTWGSAANATTLVAGTHPIFRNLSVGDYSGTSSKKYVMIEQPTYGTGEFRTYEATSITGPWTPGPAGQVPDACNGNSVFGCYAIYGHPELSTPTKLVFSWHSSVDRDGKGHLRLGAIEW